MELFRIIGVLVTLILALLSTPLLSETVVNHPDATRPLSERMKWATTEASRKQLRQFWVAYSIEQLMGEQDFIGSFYSSRKKFPTLRETITGQKFISIPPGNHMKQWVHGALIELKGESNQKLVTKEIAILLGFQSGSPDEVEISHVDLQFDLRKRTLIWLGPATYQESVALLQDAYSRSSSENRKEDLLSAIGIHKNPDLVIPILQRELTQAPYESLRAKAAFWLGYQDDRRALKILVDRMKQEKSQEVMDEALVGISEMSVPESIDALIEWTKPGYSNELREGAVFWLGQKAPPGALQILEKIAFEDQDSEIREEAIFSISEMEGDARTEALLRIARDHTNRETRKEAIFWLSQIYSERIASRLKDVADNDRDFEVQKHAVFALAELEDGKGVDELIRIAKSHPNRELRKQAIFWLGESDDPRAHQALIRMIEED